MKFVAFDPRPHRSACQGKPRGAPAITVSKNRTVSLNISAIELLVGSKVEPNNHFHVRFVTADDDVFGVELRPEAGQDTYKLVIDQKNKPRQLAGALFVDHARLDSSSTKRHPCKLLEVDGRRLLIARRTEFTSV